MISQVQKRPAEDLNRSPEHKPKQMTHLGHQLKIKKLIENGLYTLYDYGLGVGCFGTTILAQRKEQNYFIACKMVEKSKIMKTEKLALKMQERLQAEVDTWKTLNHTNIVKFLDFKESAKNIYMFLEYCQQGTLEKRLRNLSFKISLKEALSYFMQLAEGCLYLYNNNVLHRDLKPSNILFDSEGILKIADFGFAKFLSSDLKDNQLEQTGQIGTIVYMSPQVYNSKAYSIKSDVWSLGIIFYEILYRHTPDYFLGFKAAQTQDDIKVDSENIIFPKNIDVSQQLQALIRSMLVRDEESRLSITDLVQKLIIMTHTLTQQ